MEQTKHQRRDICCVCERRAIFPMTNKIGFQIGGIISKMMMTVDRSFINRKNVNGNFCCCCCKFKSHVKLWAMS